MSYLNKNGDLEKENWQLIKISKVNDKIIERLVDNLKTDISEDFFLSLESLLRIGKKAKRVIESVLHNGDKLPALTKDIFILILNFINNQDIEDPLILQLYNVDFITRARALMLIEESRELKYLKYILPLLNDPDDSVRAVLIKLLDNLNLINNPMVFHKLQDHLEKEKNLVIQKNLEEIFKKS